MKTRLSTWALLTATRLSLALGLESAAAAGLRAGLAQVDITPSQPVTLAGYASRKDVSQGVHDPLAARAIAFEERGRRLVLVSADNLGWYNGVAEPLRRALIEGCGLEPAELFLCATHTHSAPTLTLDAAQGHSHNVAYTQELQRKLVAAVRAALDGLAPVQLGVGVGSSPVGVNRREVVRDAAGQTRVVLGRNPSVLTDREVQVLKLSRPADAELVGAVYAYATHSTALGPRNYLISGDVHGLAEQFVERYFGRGMIAAGFAGASGDLDPWFRVLPGFNTTNGWLPEPVLLGTMLGEEVAHVLDGIRTEAGSGPVSARFKVLELPGKPRGVAGSSARSEPAPFTLSAGRVGELALVGLGGEVFNEIGAAIKAASPFPHTFILTHCNGADGYVPTRASYASGGYEVTSSPFAPGADEQLAAAAIELLRELRQENASGAAQAPRTDRGTDPKPAGQAAVLPEAIQPAR
ncbi:MAG: hypothetical protein FJ387_25605 [Verrucomicrobia bacterium]|nr:hypothetical protein [Verrucomicrobiota bacterium]